ncbi:hypothetical protein Pcinc_032875 [Petrolisthes cinctipes]|uniref:Schlafen AlbA-2 domain-containing protein n=1 Tax=Petrolisthes cinctipes TaxID=88211 RepID=A0AAE1ETH4_PETCI|nr:hypothetical protein Pcinc_032875 [Petrolisthes cinctipes]
MEGDGKDEGVTRSRYMEGDGKDKGVTRSRYMEGDGKDDGVTRVCVEGDGKDEGVTRVCVEGDNKDMTSRVCVEGDGKDEGMTRRYYVEGEVVRVEEDQTHEFKGHRNISIHDIHNICLGGGGGGGGGGSGGRTRTSASNTLGAMLNSGQGGTIYLGVNDNGVVRGFPLTRYQQDHIEASVEWTLGRFSPPVPDSHYCVTFVPVLNSKSNTNPSFNTTQQMVNIGRRGRPHHVAQPNYCWCDHDADAQSSLGRMPAVYVVEIHIRPWDPHQQVFSNTKGPATPPLPPLHLTEANICYMRQTCRQPALCLDDVRRLLVHRVNEHYKLKLAALQCQAEGLRVLARTHNIQMKVP